MPTVPDPVPCRWFALCTNTTTTGIAHPVLGLVPCCERCARRVGEVEQLMPLTAGQE